VKIQRAPHTHKAQKRRKKN
jgi:hypothetical protein